MVNEAPGFFIVKSDILWAQNMEDAIRGAFPKSDVAIAQDKDTVNNLLKKNSFNPTVTIHGTILGLDEPTESEARKSYKLIKAKRPETTIHIHGNQPVKWAERDWDAEFYTIPYILYLLTKNI